MHQAASVGIPCLSLGSARIPSQPQPETSVCSHLRLLHRRLPLSHILPRIRGGHARTLHSVARRRHPLPVGGQRLLSAAGGKRELQVWGRSSHGHSGARQGAGRGRGMQWQGRAERHASRAPRASSSLALHGRGTHAHRLALAEAHHGLFPAWQQALQSRPGWLLPAPVHSGGGNRQDSGER